MQTKQRGKRTNGSADLIKRLDRDIHTAEQDKEVLARETEILDRYIEGLRNARADLAGHVLNGATKHNKSYGTRVDALLAIFADRGEIAMDDLMAELSQRGRDDKRPLVHSTVSYLVRNGKVRKTDRSTWAPIEVAQAA